ncbi:hypothetical protein GW17_00017020 [Ensete ventricosum]|nr:hypothetical protein GW17_00017020 [Ensete ventricosum]
MHSEGNMGRANNRRVGSVNGQRSTSDEHSRPIGSAERTVLRRGLAGLIHAAFLFLWFGFGADKGRGEVTLRTSLRSETNNKCEGLLSWRRTRRSRRLAVAMAAEEDKSDDFYAVLGLRKECSETELRTAYKKLAMRWHPDKCLASGNAQIVEEATEKFQEIQKAYSGLFLFSSQLPCSENSQDSFQELQQLFVEMFQDDLDAGFGGSIFHSDPWAQPTNGQEYWTSMGLHFTNGRSKCSNKHGNSAVNFGKVNLEELEHGTRDFYFGVSH